MTQSHDFLFALHLSDEPHFDSMLGELVGALLVHVGYESAAIAEIHGALKRALASGRVNGQPRCDVQFRAQSGELQIVVAYAGGAEWRTTRALP